MANEPYAEWIKRDGNAQRLFKAYRNKWPDSDAQCVAIGGELYVRFDSGDGMRRVYNVGDFDDEDEWCAPRRHGRLKRSGSVGNVPQKSVATSKSMWRRRVPRVTVMAIRSRPRLNTVRMRTVVSVAAKLVKGRLSAPELCYALPSRNLRPLHHYVRMATVMAMAGVEPYGLNSFHLYHAYSDVTIWDGYEHVNRHGETAVRVIENIVRSRVARASHGKPTVEPLERTALRLYKRAGRPELNARYAHIRKRLAATRVDD